MHKGKKFIREHEDGFDAQTFYNKLHVFYATSVGTRVNASDMLSYRPSAKFEA